MGRAGRRVVVKRFKARTENETFFKLRFASDPNGILTSQVKRGAGAPLHETQESSDRTAL